MKSILIADDNAIFRQVIEVALRARGYDIRSATNGMEALQRLEEQTPDLLLLDMAMPIMDGRAALKTLRAQPRWQKLAVILMTAMTERDCLVQDPLLDVQACLTKSHFSLAQMAQTIESLIGQGARDGADDQRLAI